MEQGADRWAAGSKYEDFMGRWSRRLAPHFVARLEIPTGTHWLEVGCGTGALTKAICRHADPASATGCDPAGSFIEYARGFPAVSSNRSAICFVRSGCDAFNVRRSKFPPSFPVSTISGGRSWVARDRFLRTLLRSQPIIARSSQRSCEGLCRFVPTGASGLRHAPGPFEERGRRRVMNPMGT